MPDLRSVAESLAAEKLPTDQLVERALELASEADWFDLWCEQAKPTAGSLLAALPLPSQPTERDQ